jgi:hypothetical protein
VIGADAKLAFAREQIVLSDGRTVGEAMQNDEWIEEEILGPAFAVGEEGTPRFRLIYCEVARGHWSLAARRRSP